jgi:hypothetical protein
VLLPQNRVNTRSSHQDLAPLFLMLFIRAASVLSGFLVFAGVTFFFLIFFLMHDAFLAARRTALGFASLGLPLEAPLAPEAEDSSRTFVYHSHVWSR